MYFTNFLLCTGSEIILKSILFKCFIKFQNTCTKNVFI